MPQPHKAFSPKMIMNSSNIELFSNLASMEGFNSSILPLSHDHEGLSDHHHQTHFLNMDFHDKFPRLVAINAPIYNPMGHLFPSSHEHHNSMETVALQPHLLMNSSSVTAKPNRKNPIQSYDGGNKRKRDGKKEQDEVREVVHVRAKRGQAADSHSLAERLRREKINEKLKCLQDIVPGCYKTMGMAVMLDVIINYVQSLQNQIDFLSMKLSAASLLDDFNSSEAEEAGIQTIQGTTGQWIMEKQKLVGESYGGISQFQTAANWPLHFSTNNNTPM